MYDNRTNYKHARIDICHLNLSPNLKQDLQYENPRDKNLNDNPLTMSSSHEALRCVGWSKSRTVVFLW